MAELADAADSKSAGLRPLGVRLPLPAPYNSLSLLPKSLREHLRLLHTVRRSDRAPGLTCGKMSAKEMAQV
jgi:hypothetical protein